jgi:hypothetical protein
VKLKEIKLNTALLNNGPHCPCSPRRKKSGELQKKRKKMEVKTKRGIVVYPTIQETGKS